MFDHIIDTFLYTGQPTLEWPRWLIFTNFGRNPDTGRIIIPYLWHTVEVERGDLIVLTAIREVHAVKPAQHAEVEKQLANQQRPG